WCATLGCAVKTIVALYLSGSLAASAEIGWVVTFAFAVATLALETFVLILMFESVPVPRHPTVNKINPGRISPQANSRAIAIFISWSPDSSYSLEQRLQK